jgi:hypothetical protein
VPKSTSSIEAPTGLALWVAKQHGHSVQTMLDAYAAWLEGTTESDLLAIKEAFGGTLRLTT